METELIRNLFQIFITKSLQRPSFLFYIAVLYPPKVMTKMQCVKIKGEKMLELKNVKKSYDGNVILRDISFSAGDGEIVSILGSSGSGKTTLLNIILGITDCDKGSIFFDGKDITDVSMEDRGFNIVFQDYAFFQTLTHIRT